MSRKASISKLTLSPNSMKLIERWTSNKTAWARELLHANALELALIRASWTSAACQRDKRHERCPLAPVGTKVPVSRPSNHSSFIRIGPNARRLWWTSTQDHRALKLFSTRADLACKVTICSEIKWRTLEHRVMVANKSALSPQALLRPSSLWKISCPRSMTCLGDSPIPSSKSSSLLETSFKTKFNERTAALSTILSLKRSMETWIAVCHQLVQPVRPIKSCERQTDKHKCEINWLISNK